MLIAAGAFQFTRWKHVCLGHCRNSTAMARECPEPTFRAGVNHGICCMGCCWAVMALLFVTGVMDLFWVVTIAALMLGERLLPQGHWLARAASAGFVVWGLCLFLPLVQ